MAANDLGQLRRWIREQDADAFEDLVRQYAGLVFGTARRILRSDAEAEEISQECFLKLAQADTGVDTNVPGWLHRTATNLSLNRYKENKRRAARESVFTETKAAETQEPAWGDVEPLVDAAIEELPEDLRRVVVLHYLEGRPYREVAEISGLSQSQVVYRVQRGVDRIRAILKRKGIAVSAGSLAGYFSTGFSAEASAGLIAALGKIALAGPGAVPAGVAASTAAASSGVLAGLQPYAIAAVFLVLLASGIAALRSGGGEPPMQAAQTGVPAAAPAFAVAQQEPAAPVPTTSGLTPAASPAPTAASARNSRVSGPGEIRGIAHLDPIGRSTFNPPLPEDGFVSIKRITWTPYEIAPADPLVEIATVGENNFFRFENLPLGVYAVRVAAGGRTSVNFIALTTGEPRKHIDVGHAYRIAPTLGTVKDEAGNPLPGVNVMVAQFADTQSQATNEWQSLANTQTTTGPDGGFVLEFTGTGERAPARYAVIARKEGYATFRSEWFEGGRDDLEFRMVRGVELSGRVVDGSSAGPVANLRMRIATDFKWDRREFVTDAEGNFHVENLGPYAYSIRTTGSPLIVPFGASKIDMTKGAPGPLRLELVPGGTIAGRIFDSETKQGHAGVPLYLHGQGADLRNDIYVGYNIRQGDRTATTDAEGRYVFDGLPEGKYQVERENIPGHSKLEGDQFTKRIQWAFVRPGEAPSTADFELKRGLIATGRVVDAQGRPVDDAVVIAYDEGRQALPAVMYGPAQENWTFTDARGRFSLTGLQAGKRYYFVADRDRPFLVPDGLAAHPVGPIAIEEATSDITIRMQPHSRISATVVDAGGRPILNARLHANRVESGGRTQHFRASGPDGRVTVDKLIEGSYDLFVDAPRLGGGLIGPLKRVRVGIGEHVDAQRVVFAVPDGIQLTGRITDTAGRPVAKAQIQFSGPNTQGTESGEDGAFRITVPQAEKYRLTIQHAAYSSLVVQDYTPTSSPLMLKLQGRATVIGDVRAQGRPVRDFSIAYFAGDLSEQLALQPLGDSSGSPRNVDAEDGRFTIDRVEVGDATFVVEAEGFGSQFQILRNISENRTFTLPVFNLAPEAVLIGTVLDPAGKPAAGANVILGWHAAPSHTTDARGRFRIGMLPAGTFQVRLSHQGSPMQIHDVALRTGETVEKEFRLRPGNELRGTIRWGDQPLPRESVSFQISPEQLGSSREISISSRMMTDDEGRYAIANLADGSVGISISIRDRGISRLLSMKVPVSGGQLFEQDVTLPRGGAVVYGRVRDQDGNPVTGWLSLILESDGVRLTTLVDVDAEGRYRIDGLPAGEFTYGLQQARSPRGDVQFRSGFDAVRLAGNESMEHDVVFEIP